MSKTKASPKLNTHILPLVILQRVTDNLSSLYQSSITHLEWRDGIIAIVLGIGRYEVVLKPEREACKVIIWKDGDIASEACIHTIDLSTYLGTALASLVLGENYSLDSEEDVFRALQIFRNDHLICIRFEDDVFWYDITRRCVGDDDLLAFAKLYGAKQLVKQGEFAKIASYIWGMWE
jgi:hypothetical protein